MFGLGFDIPTLAVRSRGDLPVAFWNFRLETLPASVSFSRASTATYFNPSGGLELAAIDQPRFGYDPSGLQFTGLSVEAQALNYVSESADLSNWNHTRVTTVFDGVSSHLTRTSTTLPCYSNLAVSSLGTGASMVLSLRAKAGAAGHHIGLRIQSTYPDRLDAIVDLSDGSIVGIANTSYSDVSCVVSEVDVDGFYAIALSGVPAVTVPATVVIGPTNETRPLGGWEGQTDGLEDCYIKNVQLEVGNQATSYIPTSGATASRAADILATTGLNGVFDVRIEYGDDSTETFLSQVISDGWQPSLSSNAVKSIVFFDEGVLA